MTRIRPDHPVAPLAEMLIDLAQQAYERTGRHVFSEIVLEPDAAITFGLLPGSSVDVMVCSGSVHVSVSNSKT